MKDVFSSLGSYNYDKGKTHFNDNVVTCFLCAHSCMCWCAVKQKERSDQTETADGKDNASPLQGGSIYNSALTSFHKKTLSKFFFFPNSHLNRTTFEKHLRFYPFTYSSLAQGK